MIILQHLEIEVVYLYMIADEPVPQQLFRYGKIVVVCAGKKHACGFGYMRKGSYYTKPQTVNKVINSKLTLMSVLPIWQVSLYPQKTDFLERLYAH